MDTLDTTQKKPWLTKRSCHAAFAIFFVAMAVGVALVPYEPMEMDLADATTNVIWTEYYSKGIYHVTWEQWQADWGNLKTQSSVVEYDGGYAVVNEKGPGLSMMLVPFHILGVEFLFGPLMMACAAVGTYLLGRRIAGWKVGLMASAIVVCNVNVLAMWHRYYWTDAATMHLMVLALALFVEALYFLNGRTLDPREPKDLTRRDWWLGISFAVLSGLSFGASVSTRYAVALVGIALAIYLVAFYAIKCWPSLLIKDLKGAVSKARGLVVVAPFILGLMVVLVPLMQYNSTYFGGPFRSGYDAMSMMKFNPATGVDLRNASEVWAGDIGVMAANTAKNGVALLPTFILRMPILLLVPIGLWLLRRKVWFTLLVPWAIIAFVTYLSLSWVDMYARIRDGNIWEPRYFLPALPAIAIIGAVGINWLAFEWKGLNRGTSPGGRRFVGSVIAIAIIGAIMLWGLAPAVASFAGMNGDYRTPQGGGQRPPGGGPAPPGGFNVVNVTTDQLLNNPQDYEGRLVHIRNARVSGVLQNGAFVRSQNSTAQGSVQVALVDWPQGSIPQLSVGARVEVQGIFGRLPGPMQAGSAVVVRHGTTDYLRVIGQVP